MRLRKLFISAFVLAFVIGVVSFLVVHSTKKVSTPPVIVKEVLPDLPKPLIETKPEIIEENNEWQEESDFDFKIKLLETGEGFHGDEIEAKSGETWLGLFREGNSFSLRSTKIKVNQVHDDIVDKKPRQKTGKSVSVAGKNQPIFLMKNAGFLKQGKVKSLLYSDVDQYSDETNISNVTRKTFNLNNVNYNLFVTTDNSEKGDYLDETSKLILSDGKTEQIIYSQERCSDCGWGVYWVGDLDGDGKLDLYLDLSDHYNVTGKCLFLSSQAEKGELVKEVARFRTVGC